MTVEPTTTAPSPAELLTRLSPEQKATLAAGASLWWTHGAPEVGLEPIKVSDGPNGVRGERFDERDVALCTPCGTALAASWDVDLLRRVGAVVGDDARRQGVHVVLGPTMNIHRSPLGGRGFECYSEDPWLSGTVAGAWIEGVQSRGVAATAKHFVCNDAETRRTTVDCVVDERALREIYLVPFELATRAGVWALMTGYNRLNGAYCPANAALVTGVLKGEWDWDGLAMSDWFALGDTVGWATGGLDLEMPGPARLFGPALHDAVAAGLVDEALLDDKVARLLTLAARVGRLDGAVTAPPAPALDDPGEVLAEAAAAGFVLLKNDAGLLPLDPSGPRRIAVLGPNAGEPALQGGGSAHVAVGAVATPLESVRAAFPAAEVVHERGSSPREILPGLDTLDVRAVHEPERRGLTLAYYRPGDDEPVAQELRRAGTLIWQEDVPGLGPAAAGTVRASATLTPASDGAYELSLRGSAECRLRVGGDEVVRFVPDEDEATGGALFARRDVRGTVVLRAGEPVLVEAEMPLVPHDLNLLSVGCRAPEPADMLERAVAAAREADAVVLVVGTSDEVETESADRTTTALPGDQDELVRRVLEANPSTVVVVNAATAVDMDWAADASTVLYAWYPGQAFGPALADVLTGRREPGGRLPITIARRHEDYPAWDTTPDEAGRLEYRESVFVGYRHFDAQGLEPAFPFGHGLGYGAFAWDGLELSAAELDALGSVTAQVTLTNTGDRRAKEVVQVYVADHEAEVARPPRELKGFAAITLDPGETGTVAVTLEARAFSYWDAARGGWHADPGTFDVLAGRSSRDIRQRAQVALVER